MLSGTTFEENPQYCFLTLVGEHQSSRLQNDVSAPSTALLGDGHREAGSRRGVRGDVDGPRSHLSHSAKHLRLPESWISHDENMWI